MSKALEHDLKKLQARAFDRAECAEESLRRYHVAASHHEEAMEEWSGLTSTATKREIFEGPFACAIVRRQKNPCLSMFICG